METNRSDESTDEPKSKRQKLETDVSTSSKKPIANVDCPILNLPDDILAKIIAYVPVAQWPALELLYDFRPATLIAWRQLRNINVDQEFLIKPGDRSSISASIVWILEKLLQCSPFLTSISGIDFLTDNDEFNLDAIHSLAQFERLQSITLGDLQKRVPLEGVVELLELTRSRASLKEVHLFQICAYFASGDALRNRFASSFVNGREIKLPLKLEKFAFSSQYDCLRTALDTMDVARLADLRLAGADIEPQQLTSIIERALNLSQIELLFLHCKGNGNCDVSRLQANKQLLSALAAHENLTAIKFDYHGSHRRCESMNFEPEFIQMLKSIGRRGQLRKLAMEQRFVASSSIDMNKVSATIRDYIPYLQSIKVYVRDISEELVSSIITLADLEEICFAPDLIGDGVHTPAAITSAIEDIVPLSHLKRLALGMDEFDNMTSRKCLSAATTLTDLRIKDAGLMETDFFEKWSEKYASNLQMLMLSEVGGGDDHVEEGLVKLLERAVRLRVLILRGYITDRVLSTIAECCPKLEIFGVHSSRWNAVEARNDSRRLLQEIVDRCNKLRRFGGFNNKIREELRFPKYRKVGEVDTEFWKNDFDSTEYD